MSIRGIPRHTYAYIPCIRHAVHFKGRSWLTKIGERATSDLICTGYKSHRDEFTSWTGTTAIGCDLDLSDQLRHYSARKCVAGVAVLCNRE